jgi:hypothetical protein
LVNTQELREITVGQVGFPKKGPPQGASWRGGGGTVDSR